MMAKDMSPSIPFLLAPKYYPAKDSLAIGDVGFDPLGLAEYFDIKWLREAEIKHGRVVPYTHTHARTHARACNHRDTYPHADMCAPVHAHTHVDD